jgi:iron complex transport system ATP-binding protein
MTFAQATDYMLLDEPLNNLDLTFARGLMHRLRRLADDHGRTIVVVLHDINYAAAWADRIVALKDGALAAAGTPDEVIRPEILEAIYGVRIAVTRHAGRPAALYHC